jgi:hypothetical protein
MTISGTNVVAFLINTYVYYAAIKPSLTYDKLNDENIYSNYLKNNYSCLAIYLLLVIVVQCLINVNIINSTCGGSTSSNIGYAGMITIIPWILIFGVLLAIINIYPGFKSAFSDVIGYFWVSTSANKLITELLVNREIQPKIDDDTNLNPEEKIQMQNAADAILKIIGNTGVLINKITPSNFQNFWNTLTPLMKDQYKPKNGVLSPDAIQMRDSIFNLTVTRDNVGEALWYIYTGVLVSCIVQLNIASKSCNTNVATMEQNYAKFQQEEAEASKEKELTQSTVYTS